jgi:hypothetical protein
MDSRLYILDDWSTSVLISVSGFSAFSGISLIFYIPLRTLTKISHARLMVGMLTFFESFVMLFLSLPLYFWLNPSLVYFHLPSGYDLWYASWLFGASFFVFTSGLFIIKRKYSAFSIAGLLMAFSTGLVVAYLTIPYVSASFNWADYRYLESSTFSALLLFFFSFLIAGVCVLSKQKRILHN